MTVSIVARSIWLNPGNRGLRMRKTVDAVLWQLHKRLLRVPRTLVLANGVYFEAYPDCVVSSSLVYAAWPEYRELMFLRSRLGKDNVVVDVGANVGHISLLLADVVGWRNIVALEPTPVSFRRLAGNWRLNHWRTDSLLRMAAGAERVTAAIPDTPAPETTNAISTGARRVDEAEVEVVPLDDLRGLWSGRCLGLLKVDVEGSEERVFQGARRTIREDRPRIIMFESLGHHLAPGIGAELTNSGYIVFQLGVDGKPQFEKLTAQNLFAVAAEDRDTLIR